jgi:lipopolysaccharide biosynthesis regulator YciM
MNNKNNEVVIMNEQSIWINHKDMIGESCSMEYVECENCGFTAAKKGKVCPNCSCFMKNGGENIYYRDIKKR